MDRVQHHNFDEGDDGLHAWTARKPTPAIWKQHYDFLASATGGRSRSWDWWPAEARR